jgi:hypothetical protein
MFTMPESLFTSEPISPITGHNIWCHNPVKDTPDFSDVGLLQESIVVDKNIKDRFLYKSYDIASKLSPGGVWNIEMIDDKNVIFRRANGAIDIRPSNQLNCALCVALFLHQFYPAFLSWSIMAVVWSSFMCHHDPGKINGVSSWSSLLPQLYRIGDYILEQFVDYLEYVESGNMLYGMGRFNGINVSVNYDEVVDVEADEDTEEEYEDTDEDTEEEYEDTDEDTEEEYEDTDDDVVDECPEDEAESDELDTSVVVNYYEVVSEFNTKDSNFIKWVKNGNEFINDSNYPYIEEASDKDWLYALAGTCVESDILFEDVVDSFRLDMTQSDDDWEKDISTRKPIKPIKSGRWLRSSR